MAAQEPVSVRLSDFSASVAGMSPEAVLETAALGSLLDWELVNFCADHGARLVRQSFTYKDDEVLMVIKAVRDDLPYVVFISRQSPRGCVSTFIRKAEAGTLNWYPDKYG